MVTVTQTEANGRALATSGRPASGGGTWAEWCLAFLADSTGFTSAGSAGIAYAHSRGIEQPRTDYQNAPRGAWHWWSCCGGLDHIAIDLDGGGTRVMMSTGFALDSVWGNAAGSISVPHYNTHGNPYLGWTTQMQGQSFTDLGSPGAPAVPPISTADGQTLQRLAQFGGYTGPIDGIPGVNTWKGVQTVLRTYGYSGVIDGAPGANTYMALQRLAQEGGYTGPVDGVPGTSTYAGVAAWVTAHTNAPPPSSQVGVYGIDVSGYQLNLSFPTALSAGFQWSMVKEGGSNVSPTYVSTSYSSLVDAARNAGMVVGHYWVSGHGAPADDAAFFVNNLYDYRTGDLIALDNEGVDSGIVWDDNQTATFINAVKTALGVAPFFYTYRSILQSHAWTATQAAGAKLWIADPDHAPGSPQIFNYSDWAIHQYGQSNIGGVPVDLNIAKLSAFNGFATPPFGATNPPTIGSTPPATAPTTWTNAQGVILQKIAQQGGYAGPLDGVPGGNTWLGVQTVLHNKEYYSGSIDGVPGTNTYKGLQLLAGDYGYGGPIDGAPGANTFVGLQNYLNAVASGIGTVSSTNQANIQRIAKAGGYTGPIDGALGASGWKGMQTVLTGYGYAGPQDGAPGVSTYKALQRLAVKGGYTGPIDGAMGTNSWKGVQTVLQGFGYSGPIDGAPGTNTWMAFQRMAGIGGYTGPVDGALGAYSWRGIQKLLHGAGYTGPIDGVPGTNTYKALQVLARNGGYGGPIDGVPGTNTWGSLATLVR